ncbi:hypothetical protein CEXT_572021 [Caerostris extrusa]|uniref:Uncharacterized protein n=1 Tax=Caerostris extrusa TaxID=172846 RepID=A0AAV4TNG0_CAEEX|nr:hypothetical protein CEXT_572021 [Caerostris extrusa]
MTPKILRNERKDIGPSYHPLVFYLRRTRPSQSSGNVLKVYEPHMYEGKPFYSINYHEDSFLPLGFLRGANVAGLFVNAHLQGLEEKAFEGVVRLEHIFMLNATVNGFEIRALI